MSKRDDLDNEARGEMGLFGALIGGTSLWAIHSHNKRNKKENLKIQIENKRAEISRVEKQISEEKGKFFLIKDDEKINSLQQKRNQLVKENNDLVAQYNKL